MYSIMIIKAACCHHPRHKIEGAVCSHCCLLDSVDHKRSFVSQTKGLGGGGVTRDRERERERGC